MFANLSNLSQGVNTAFVVILSICFFFLIGLTIVMLIFIYRYNSKRESRWPDQIEGNNSLEVLWTVIPILIVIAMFYYGWIGWTPLYSNAPKGSMPIKTVGRMWNWHFEYENGKKNGYPFYSPGKTGSARPGFRGCDPQFLYSCLPG